MLQCNKNNPVNKIKLVSSNTLIRECSLTRKCLYLASAEKASNSKSIYNLNKYEKKVVESYEKQARKLEATYKTIFLALENHKNQQLNALRTLLDKQKDLIKRARIELDNIVAYEDGLSPADITSHNRVSIGPDDDYCPSLASSG